jgi:hypothetical protein
MDSLGDLIVAAQSILENGFSVQDFRLWQELAFVTVLGLLGPLHYYTRQFCRFTTAPTARSLLTAEGILEAVRAEISSGVCVRHPDGRIETVSRSTSYTPWASRPKKWYPFDSLCSKPT